MNLSLNTVSLKNFGASNCYVKAQVLLCLLLFSLVSKSEFFQLLTIFEKSIGIIC